MGENRFDMQGSTFNDSMFGTVNIGGGQAVAGAARRPAEVPVRRAVFVVHGRDEQARRAVFEFLRALDLQPLEWEAIVDRTGNAAPSVLEVVRAGFEVAAAVVVLLTPDDFAALHPSLRQPGDPAYEREFTGQPRANVLFEAGMAMALQPSRTVLVQIGPVRAFTDLGGLDFVQLDDSPVKLKNIANRLARAGCQVDMLGDAWLDVSRFAGLAALNRTLGQAP